MNTVSELLYFAHCATPDISFFVNLLQGIVLHQLVGIRMDQTYFSLPKGYKKIMMILCDNLCKHWIFFRIHIKKVLKIAIFERIMVLLSPGDPRNKLW